MTNLSVILSVHNRGTLLRRAMEGYLWQSMPPEEWELVIVDDLSTEDVSEAYAGAIGKINILHIRMDHTRHPLFGELNPGWRPGLPKHWYHTPAISTNIGCAAARGRVLGLCHPEILHAPDNFRVADEWLDSKRNFLFGVTWLGTPGHNVYLSECSWTSLGGWEGFLSRMKEVDPPGLLGASGHFWYTSFIPREAMLRVRGVDVEYMRGVAFEDDDLRERLRAVGWPPILTQGIAGFHQDHSDEKEVHRQRDTEAWHRGLACNRALYETKVKTDGFAQKVNLTSDWTASDCIVSRTRFTVGSSLPKAESIHEL